MSGEDASPDILSFAVGLARANLEKQIAEDEAEIKELIEAFTAATEAHDAAVEALKGAEKGSLAALQAAERTTEWERCRVMGKMVAREERLKRNRDELAKPQ